jgi:hypothetical protein
MGEKITHYCLLIKAPNGKLEETKRQISILEKKIVKNTLDWVFFVLNRNGNFKKSY